VVVQRDVDRLPETADTRRTVSDEPQLGELQGGERRETATQDSSGIAVPESMLEPAQALDAATGLDVVPSANSVATVNIQQNIIVTQGRNGPAFFTRAIWYLFVGWWLTGRSGSRSFARSRSSSCRFRTSS
jgi:hypothetical protein